MAAPIAVLAAMLQLPVVGGATPQHDAFAARYNAALQAALSAPQVLPALHQHFQWHAADTVRGEWPPVPFAVTTFQQRQRRMLQHSCR